MDLDQQYIADRLEPLLEPNHREPIVPRLETTTLKRVLDLAKAEFRDIETFPVIEDKYMSKAELIWKMSSNIIMTQEQYGSEAIELMETLVYFGSVRIDFHVFTSRNVLDTEFALSKTLLQTLEYYGLIEIYDGPETWASPTIILHSPLLLLAIRQKTEPVQEDLLRRCFNILRKPTYCDVHYQTTYLTAVWAEALKHTDLVQRFKSVGLKLCKTLYTASPMFIDKNTYLITQTSRRFKAIFQASDPAIIWLQCVELEMLIAAMENVEGRSCEIEVVLDQCQKCRVIMDRYTKSKGGRDDILELFGRIAYNIFTLASRTKEFKNKLLEESLEFYKLLHNRRRNIFDYTRFYPGIVRCLQGLHRTNEILELLREIRKIIQTKKLKMDRILAKDYYYFLHCIPKSILDLKIVRFPNHTGGLDGLEKSILEELLFILEFGYTYVSQRLTRRDEVSIGRYFPEAMLNLVICLMKLEKIEELLVIVIQAHVLWKIILIVHPDGYAQVSELECDDQYMFSTRMLANKYLRVHSLIFEMAVINKNYDLDLKVRILETLLTVTQDLCSHSLGNDFYRDFPSEDAASFLIIQCFLQLNRVNGLINYSKEYEKLLRRKFEGNLVRIAQAMIAFGDKQVTFLKPVPNRVEYFPLLKSIKLSAKTYGKIISVDLHNMNLDTIKTAKQTIEFCNHRLQLEPNIDMNDGWNWGVEWYKYEKQERDSAAKLFM